MVEENSENSDQQLTCCDCERYTSDTHVHTQSLVEKKSHACGSAPHLWRLKASASSQGEAQQAHTRMDTDSFLSDLICIIALVST